MFDKLIESDSKGADFTNRSRYFVVSSVVVGIMFLSAVVFSLYAADIGLGNDEFELSAMLAPPPSDIPEPKQPRQMQSQADNNKSELPIRQANIARLDQVQPIPTSLSIAPNTQQERPEYGDFKIGPVDSGPAGPPTVPGQPSGPGTSSDPGSSNETEEIVAIKIPDPPAIKPAVATPPTQSLGVINGRASYLPKPSYPATAIAVHAQGNVSVQVTIDENGRVIASRAVSGHPLLKGVAEKAAWNAKFTPTLLSKVPVKVTGVIVYKFSRS